MSYAMDRMRRRRSGTRMNRKQLVWIGAVMAGLVLVAAPVSCMIVSGGVSALNPLNPERAYIRDYLDRNCDDVYKIKTWRRTPRKDGGEVHLVVTREIVDNPYGNSWANETRTFFFDSRGKCTNVMVGEYMSRYW